MRVALAKKLQQKPQCCAEFPAFSALFLALPGPVWSGVCAEARSSAIIYVLRPPRRHGTKPIVDCVQTVNPMVNCDKTSAENKACMIARYLLDVHLEMSPQLLLHYGYMITQLHEEHIGLFGGTAADIVPHGRARRRHACR